jgi:hypothetical protein
LDDALGFIRVTKTHQHLVQHDVVENLETGRSQLLREAARLGAIPFNQFSNPVAPKGA